MVVVGFLKIRFDAKLGRGNSKRYSTSAAIASEAVTAIRTVSSLGVGCIHDCFPRRSLCRPIVSFPIPIFN